MNEMLNALESWSLYDSVLVGVGQESKNVGWYESYLDMGNQNQIPFFNQRNRSGVGVPYCNLDSSENLAFAYHCYSLGVEFYSSPFTEVSPDTFPVEVETPNSNNTIFTAELMKHASVRMQLSQDEKLLANVGAVPAGAGLSGITTSLYSGGAAPLLNNGNFTQFTNGVPTLLNRWIFAEPVEMPRNVNIQVSIVFSDYARELLRRMSGPGYMSINYAGLDFESSTVETVSMMRVSMFGKREVQGRNRLHF